MNKLKYLFQLSTKDKLLIIEIIALLSFAKLCIKVIRFNILTNWIGKIHRETARESKNSLMKLFKIKRFIKSITKYLPWESVCYDKAIAAKLILNRRKIPSTLYIGLVKSKYGQLDGHAWVRAGNFYITGGMERKKYHTIAFFS